MFHQHLTHRKALLFEQCFRAAIAGKTLQPGKTLATKQGGDAAPSPVAGADDVVALEATIKALQIFTPQGDLIREQDVRWRPNL